MYNNGVAMSEMKKKQPVGLAACARMDSCLAEPTPDLLADALSNDDLHSFIEVLNRGLDGEDNSLDVNEELANHDFSTVLHLAVQQGKENFVRALLKQKDINPNHPHRTTKKFPLHVAAENGEVRILEYLLMSGGDVNAKMENGSTALHQVAVRSAARWAKEGERSQMRNRFVEAAKLLLTTPGINVDYANNIGVTPLYFAVDKGTEEVAKVLLDHRACVTVDVDGETIEDLMEEKMPDLYKRVNLQNNRRSGDTIENKLFHLLYMEAHDPGKFIPTWEEAEKNNNKVDPNADNGTYSFLQYACDQGLDDIVKFLLEEKMADPNHTSPHYKMAPLVIAGHHGYYKIVKNFKEFSIKNKYIVDFGAVDGIKQENILHKVLKAESKAYINYEHRNYDKCLTLLLDNNPMMQRMIQPAIDAPDQLGNTPLHTAAYLFKENAIRKLLRSGANIGSKNDKEETPIEKIDPSIMEEFLDECLHSDGLPVSDDFQLMFKYAFLGPPLRREWKQEQLLKEDEEANDGEEMRVGRGLPEAEPLWYLSQSPNHRHLLTHPVISSFLCLKWRRIRPYYYINLAFYLAFVGLLTAFLILNTMDLTSQDNKDEHKDVINFLRYATGIFVVALALREVFQALVSFRRYFFNLENIMEVAMILICFALILGLFKDELTIRCLSGAALLFSWAEMVLMFGRHPKMSTYITMFSTVCFNFFLFLSWYSSIIIAFGLSFYIILARAPPENEDEEPTNGYFASPSKALLKTVVMSLTGEIEFEGIDFNGLFGVFMFLLYVFFVMLVLVNLLNGLAVSDITEIQKHAEIVSHVSRVELISYMESMLLGDPFHFLTNWPPVKGLRKLPSGSCLRTFYSLRPVRKMFDTLIGNTLLFQNRLRRKIAVFKPNQTRYEDSLPGTKTDNLLLDSTILKSATELVIKKQQDETAARLEQMEKTLMLLAKQNNHLIALMNERK